MKHCEYRALTREEINEVLCSTHVCMLCPMEGGCGCMRMDYTFTEHEGMYTFCLKGEMARCRCEHEKVTLRIDRCLYGGNEMVEVIGCMAMDPSGCRVVVTAQAGCVTGQAYTCHAECRPCEWPRHEWPHCGCHEHHEPPCPPPMPPKCELECVCEWKCEPERQPCREMRHECKPEWQPWREMGRECGRRHGC